MAKQVFHYLNHNYILPYFAVLCHRKKVFDYIKTGGIVLEYN